MEPHFGRECAALLNLGCGFSFGIANSNKQEQQFPNSKVKCSSGMFQHHVKSLKTINTLKCCFLFNVARLNILTCSGRIFPSHISCDRILRYDVGATYKHVNGKVSTHCDVTFTTSFHHDR